MCIECRICQTVSNYYCTYTNSLCSITVSYISIGTIERVKYTWATKTRQNIYFNTILKLEYSLDQSFPL